MAVTIYRDTDPGAAVLSGANGSLINLLDNTIVPLGWTKVFTGTNKAVYQNARGIYFRIDDAYFSIFVGGFALISGFETMTDVDTGTGEFPNTAVHSAMIRKAGVSTVAGPKAYIVAADSATCYLFIHTEFQSDPVLWEASGFGDFFEFNTEAPSPWRSFVGACSGPANSAGGPFHVFASHVEDGTNIHLLAIQRSYTGAPGDVEVAQGLRNELSVYGNLAWESPGPPGQPLAKGFVAYPSVGRIMISEIHIGENAVPTVRGKFRGLWHWCHSVASVADGSDFIGGALQGLGGLENRTFEIRRVGNIDAVWCFETSNTWDTNVDS